MVARLAEHTVVSRDFNPDAFEASADRHVAKNLESLKRFRERFGE